MMKLWLERYSRPTSLAPGAVVSVVVHTVLIGAAVIATTGQASEDGAVELNNIARFLAPPNRTAGQLAQTERILYVALGLPRDLPSASSVPVRVTPPLPPASGLDLVQSAPLEELIGPDSVYSVVEVDSAASRYEWSAAPIFPPRMLAEGRSGAVMAEWVVDVFGYADMSTVRILMSTHDDFTKSVRDALPFMRFRPAKIGTTTVRQRVQQEFSFRIVPPQPDTAGHRMPA